MPELPEVETVKRGITPSIGKQTVKNVIIRQPKLRYLIPSDLPDKLIGQEIISIERRSKYLILRTSTGYLIIHLGMSGRLFTLNNAPAPGKHDHVDIIFNNGICLRYQDPRRFGMVLWTDQDPTQHKLIAHLGPEPLTEAFCDQHLFKQAQRRSITVKQFIMDSKVVVGVGNIYASEALFMAGIYPETPANKVDLQSYKQLTQCIKKILAAAIEAGGTTFRDFKKSDGKPGYFQQKLYVYGRDNEPCRTCNTSIKKITQGQRSTFFCTICQPQGTLND